MPEVSVIVELRVEVDADTDPVVLEQAIWSEGRRAARDLYSQALEVLDEAAVEQSGGAAHTLYVVAPSHEQGRLRPLFQTLIASILAAAYERASESGGGIDPALLVVLDEAANIAPLRDLDTLASTAAGPRYPRLDRCGTRNPTGQCLPGPRSSLRPIRGTRRNRCQQPPGQGAFIRHLRFGHA